MQYSYICFSLTQCYTSFVKQHLHGGMPESIDVEALKKEVEELRQKNSDLESQVAQLQAEVCCLFKLCIVYSVSKQTIFMFSACKVHYRRIRGMLST